jgi:hypothetical protein
MPLTRAQRHDTRDLDSYELTLIRATHYLWRLSRLESEPLSERMAILKAIETMAVVKRAYRKELADRREVANARVRERFAAREGIAA